MFKRIPPFHALRAFEATARLASVKLAADELAVTATAVSHQLRQLEDFLGVKLFERYPRRLQITEQGRLLYPGVRDGFERFGLALAQLQTRDEPPPLRLTATNAFVARRLLGLMPALSAACPEVQIHLHADDTALDLTSHQADLAIRFGAGKWPGLSAHKLLSESYAPLCSPALSRANADQLAPQDLIHFEWRKNFRRAANWQRWWNEVANTTANATLTSELKSEPRSAGLYLSDENLAIQAALAGQGVALLGTGLLARELLQGDLIALASTGIKAGDYYLVYSRARRAEPALMAVVAALRHLFAAENRRYQTDARA